MPPPYRYIAIEGNIGAGKTTLATLLADHLGARLVLEEFAGNSFLPKFYAEPQRYAFPLEISFLADRYKQLKELVAKPDLFAQPVVTDYLLIKSRLFARINLEPAEYELFVRIFEAMDVQLPQPDVLIFLHAPVLTLQDHIRRRGREYEQAIGDQYLERVSHIYDQYINNLAFPVIVIDTAAFDFSTHEHQLKALLGLLSGELQPKKYFLDPGR
jgi:deoxyadenosine/deoxycytidine kinase